MVTSILFNSSISLSSKSSLAPPQLKLDQALLSFSDQASDPYILSGMVAGSFAFRFMKSAIFTSASKIFSPLGSQVLATSIGFASEVTAFEGSQRILRVKVGGADKSLLAWKGSNGLQSGLVNAAITLGALKVGGTFTANQNIILQHGLGDAAMVFSHRLSGSLGISEKSTGSFAEEFVLAEITTLQMQAGMSLVQGEKALDSSIKALEFAFSKTTQSLSTHWSALASEVSLQEQAPILFMASGGRRGTTIPPGSGRHTTNPSLSGPSRTDQIPDSFTAETMDRQAVLAHRYIHSDGSIEIVAPSSNPRESELTIRIVHEKGLPLDHKRLAPGERLTLSPDRKYYLRTPGLQAAGDHLGNWRYLGRVSGSEASSEWVSIGTQKKIDNVRCFVGRDGQRNQYLVVEGNPGEDVGVRVIGSSSTFYSRPGAPIYLEPGKAYEVRTPNGWKKVHDFFETR